MKISKLLTVLLLSFVVSNALAEDSIPTGVEFRKWNNKIDYINIISPVDINQYNKIVLLPFDYSKVEYPEKSDQRYTPLVNALEKFPGIVQKRLSKKFKKHQIIIAEDNNPTVDDKTLLLQLSIDMLFMGSLEDRIMMGYGIGAQQFRIAVSLRNNAGYIWNFLHERHSSNGLPYEECLTLEMEYFNQDIIYVLNKVK